jgi:hypothetical protein
MDVLSGDAVEVVRGRVPVGEVLSRLPVALLAG